MHHFPLMARFNEWANARLYGAVERLSDENYRLDRGLFFGSIHRTLNHLMVVDRLWTRRIDGEPHGIVSLDMQLYEDFAELSDARVQEDRRLIRQVDGLVVELVDGFGGAWHPEQDAATHACNPSGIGGIKDEG